MLRPKLSVLLVEDDPDHVLLVEMALRQARLTGFQLEHVDCLQKAEAYLSDKPADVVLLDLGLPGCNGLTALSRLHRHFKTVPIVVLTSNCDETQAGEAIAQGAQDYLRKDELTTNSLERVIRYAVQRQRMVVDLQAANALLDHRNKRLAQVCETAHQFVDHVSHEFRTPLTVIKEFVSIMRDGLAGSVTSQQREYLEIVDDRADDLAIIVDDMLDVSRLEAGLLSVWRRKANVQDIVENVSPLLERKAQVKKATFTVELEENLPIVFCDPEKIGRVIVNLVANAIKFCKDEGEVTLWARPAAEGSEVVIGVTDNGAGIAPENLRLIFERFHQVEGACHRSTKGFGLGLSIAKELVNINFGQIEAQSEPGKGSTFSFTLPAWNPVELAIRCLDRLEQIDRSDDEPSQVMLAVATVEPVLEERANGVVDEFLSHSLHSSDLALRIRPNKWLIIARCREGEADLTLDRLLTAWNEANRNRPSGLLPKIHLRSKGTWDVRTGREEILQQFHGELTGEDEGPMRQVLVVDDDRETLRGLKIRLRSLGYEVLEAHDGWSAIELADEHRPNAILMDNYMPGLDGVDALIELGQRERTAAIPVVMISASLRDQQKALKQGARFFLQKPCDVETIATALEEAIARPTPVGAC